MNRLPVLRLGKQRVAVFFNHLGRIGHVRSFVKQGAHALNIDLQGQNLRQQPGQVLDRLKYADGIGGEGGQGAKQHQMLMHHHPAAAEYDRRRQIAAEITPAMYTPDMRAARVVSRSIFPERP